jgi:spermidine/putrescine transport system ATP-binding protein
MLELVNLTKRYGDVVAVDRVSLKVEQGEFFCLLGSSGCGKTTVLRLIAGFEKRTDGRILLDGRDLADDPPHRRDVNTVFQSYALFPHLTVYENIAYGLRVRKTARNEIEGRVGDALALVGMTGLERRFPDQLSGGQQQRVALARALVNRPRILLLDEPLSALDMKIAEQTRLELAALQRQVGITFIYVTHNQTEALALADRIAVMHNGVIEQCGTPGEIYDHPKTRFVADFIGSMNFFDGCVASVSDRNCQLRLWDRWDVVVDKPVALAAGNPVLFCLRPEQLKLSLLPPRDFENGIPGTLRRTVYQGDATLYLLELHNGRIVTVSQNNYLARLSRDFFDLGDEYQIIWSRSSGETIRV